MRLLVLEESDDEDVALPGEHQHLVGVGDLDERRTGLLQQPLNNALNKGV